MILRPALCDGGQARGDGAEGFVALQVAEVSRILRYDNIESRLDNPPAPVAINQLFPTDWMHGWKFIAFGPDGKIYVPVGAPCNVCNHCKDEPRKGPESADAPVEPRAMLRPEDTHHPVQMHVVDWGG